MARRSVVAAISTAVLALGVGVGVTAWRAHVRPRSATITRAAPELGPMAHTLLPDLHDALMIVPDRPHDPAEARASDRASRIHRLRRFRVSTNHLGLRGPLPRQPRTGPRVLCVGDSVTFGWGLEDDQTLPATLQHDLGVEVINGGVPAQKPTAMAGWTEAHAADLDVDLLLFIRRPDWSGGQDPWRDYVHAVQRAARAVAPAPIGVVLPPVSTFDPMGSKVYAAEAAEAARRLAPIPVIDLTAAFRAALPLPGVVMEQSDGQQRVYRLPGHELLIQATAPDAGLAPEIVQAFEDAPDMKEPLFFDGGHPTAQGVKVFAAALEDWMKARGWPPPAQPGAGDRPQ